MTTIKDISKACGVSPATVSKALNGYPEISDETVELVQRTAREMQYMPDAAARSLKTKTTHNIGVLFVDGTRSGLTHEYFSLILNSIKEEAEVRGYDITFISRYIGGSEVSFLEHCRYRRYDGVVIACVDFESNSVVELVRSTVPVVTIDYTFDNVSCILSDNFEGSYALTSYLLDAGHRKIAYIHGEESSVTGKRLNGFYQAMEHHGVEVRDEYVVAGQYHSPEIARKVTSSLLDLPDPPTAIMYPDDFAYLGGATEIRSRGLSIPEDISTVGYDGINLATLIDPALVTWHQNAEEIGRQSARKLIETIEHRKASVAEQISVAGEMLNGCSVRKIDF